MDEKEIQSFLIIFSVIAFSLALTVILLFTIFQKRKNMLLRDQQLAEAKFRKEITETQIEIKEETLRNVSWELHDNIGQLITLAKIQVQTAKTNPQAIDDAIDTLGDCLQDLRSLSKSINPTTMRNLSLVEILRLDIERFNRLRYIKATLHCSGDPFPIENKVETIIFRMFQEFFTNTVKHSKASELNINLAYVCQTLIIKAKDNGDGFDTSKINPNKGIGLSNIKNRAKLIGAQVKLESEINVGTKLLIIYKIKKS